MDETHKSVIHKNSVSFIFWKEVLSTYVSVHDGGIDRLELLSRGRESTVHSHNNSL